MKRLVSHVETTQGTWKAIINNCSAQLDTDGKIIQSHLPIAWNVHMVRENGSESREKCQRGA